MGNSRTLVSNFVSSESGKGTGEILEEVRVVPIQGVNFWSASKQEHIASLVDPILMYLRVLAPKKEGEGCVTGGVSAGSYEATSDPNVVQRGIE